MHGETKSGLVPSRDAWVLFGDVERALLQAGMLDVLVGVLPKPSYIYASGVSVTNALLSLSGTPQAVVCGWESLRSAHFLAPAGLLLVPALRWTQALTSQLARIVSDTIVKAGLPTKRPVLKTATANGLESAAGPSGELRPARLRETLARDDNTPASIAATISAAAGAGAERIYFFGLDPRLRGHPMVTAAAGAVSGTAPELQFLAADSGDTPGALSYLLPGSGGPDRLIRDGRIAAHSWLKRTGTTPPATERPPMSV